MGSDLIQAGVQDPALETIRAQVGTLDDRIPFLLLPVRLETRFMKVDHPLIEQPGTPVTAATVSQDLDVVEQKLRAISQQPLEVAEKPKKKELYAQLDQIFNDLNGQCAKLEGYHRDAISATPDQAAQIQAQWAKIQTVVSVVPGQLVRLKSNYLRAQYQTSFVQVQTALTRVENLFASVTIPKMNFLAAFKQSPAAAYRQASESALRSLQTPLAENALRDAGFLEKLKTSLSPLEQHTGALLVGAPQDIDAISRCWQTASGNMKRVTAAPVVAGQIVSAPGKGDLPEFRQTLARVQPRFYQNLDLTFSVQTYQIMRQDLTALQGAMKKAAGVRGSNQLAGVSVQLQAMLDRTAPRLNRPVLLPAQYKAALQATFAQLDLNGFAQHAKQRDPKQFAVFQKNAAAYGALLGSLQTEAGLGPAVAVPTKTVDELWVRIYPDDVFVHTHEPELTAEEIEAGKTYWREQWLTGGNQELVQAAWRLLSTKYTVQRAAWIVRQLKPVLQHPVLKAKSDPEKMNDVLKTLEAVLAMLRGNAGKKPEGVAREAIALLKQAQTQLAGLKQCGSSLLARIRELWTTILHLLRELTAGEAGLKPAPWAAALRGQTESFSQALEQITAIDARVPGAVVLPLVFPDVPVKKDAWVHPPQAFVLPERFVVLTQVDGAFTNVKVGANISDPLILGLNPQTFTNNVFSYDAEGNLNVDPSIKWLTDYQEAVKQGMGVVIPLSSAEKQKGFDKVLVLGVKNLAAKDAQAKLEALLENHHYKADGMEFIPAGTPTNNTDQKQAGFMSREDKDAAWKIECGDPLFQDGETDPVKIADGQRLARALGINAAVFQHIGNSGLNEISQAHTLSRVLAPATLGYFLEEIIAPLFPRDAAGRLRDYFTQYVIGRGWLPSLRIGTQPYGLLVTSAFSRFRMFQDEDAVLKPATGAPDPQQRFDILLRRFLQMLHEDWVRVLLPMVKCAANTDPANPQAHFMTMLGLEAHSLVNYFRYSVNCASRLAYAATSTSNVNFDPSAYYSPYAFLERVGSVLNLSPDERVALQSTVLSLPLYRMRFLENQGDLKGAAVADTLSEDTALPAGNFIQWLGTKNPYDIWNHNQTQGLPSTSLLFLLMRHAWLLNYRTAALDILEFENLITEDIRTKAGSPDYYHTYSPTSKHHTFITKWNYLFTGLSKLDGLFDSTFDPQSSFYQRLQPAVSLAEYLLNLTAEQKFSQHQQFLDKLKAMRADFGALENVPTAKLDRWLSEHLDTCSYRFDAWQMGLAQRRLQQQRAQAPTGIFLGAFGWVEDLRPDAGRPLAANIPAGLGHPGDGPVYTDMENEGFIHAPSINHAMTAAMLRSGYVANRQTQDLRNPLAVNLTSERVRMALRLLEGVRQGVDVGALLGYQFERGLHERYADRLELDKYVYPFRRNFPGQPSVDGELEKNPEPRQVVDGAKLLKTVRDYLARHGTVATGATLYEALKANPRLYPFDLVDAQAYPDANPKPSLLPASGTPELDAVLKEIDRMADAFDALSDLMMAESVYQLAQGNQTRASAVAAALAEGKNPAQPEIINTPRTGSLITQRVILHVPPISGRSLSPQSGLTEAQRNQNLDLARAPHWDSAPFSPRALAEPSLNRWLGTVGGDPENIRCWVEYASGDTTASRAVSLKDLQLQPLDAVLLLGSPGAAESASELNARIAYYVRQTLNLGLDTPLTVKAGERSEKLLKDGETLKPEIKTFYEAAPLLRSLAEFLANGRPGAADDLILPEDNNYPDRLGQDLDELKLRLSDLNNTVQGRITDWLDLFDPGHSHAGADLTQLKADDYVFNDGKLAQDNAYLTTKLADLRAFLFAGAGLGIPYAVPQSVLEDTPEQVKALAKQGNEVFRALLGRWLKAQPLLAQGTVAGCLDAAQELAGKNFRPLPLFKANNPDDLKNAAAQGPALLAQAEAQGTPFPLDAWLQGLAKSRKKMATLETLKLLGALLNLPFPDPAVAQLPAGDYWVGAKYPADYQPARHTLSLVNLNLPADWSQPLCGLVVDEWTEALPNAEELTGITFNYNQPDATAPQSLLLAVTPVETGHWVWDNLVYTLLDTLEMAKLRGVEPEHVDKTLFSQLLPAVLGEVVPAAMQDESINPLGVQVVVDFADNNPAQS